MIPHCLLRYGKELGISSSGGALSSQYAEYYPFGMISKYWISGSSHNKYLYNGKELQDDSISTKRLDWYDYGARFYDPQIGRWNGIDPLAGGYESLSPYQYCNNNPVRNIDIGGMGFLGAYDMWDETGAADVYIYDYDAYAEDVRNATNDPNAPVSFLNGYVSMPGGNGICENSHTESSGEGDPQKIEKTNKTPSGQGGSSMAAVGALTLAGEAAGTTALSAAIVVTLPLVVAGDTRQTPRDYSYVVYTKTNAAGSVYVGRTSGFGTPEEVVRRRDAGHHMNAFGYGPAVVNSALVNVGSLQGYPAIRGREQQVIDFYGGVGSPMVGNSIRGVSQYNPLGPIYWGASNLMFGPLMPYSGY